MSLLASSRVAARAVSLPPELVVACLHTSAARLSKGSRHSQGSSGSVGSPSRTRLVKDLKSSSNSKYGKLEVARVQKAKPSKPQEPEQKRDEAPHVGRAPLQERTPIRRLTTRELDLRKHGKLYNNPQISHTRARDEPRARTEPEPRPHTEPEPRTRTGTEPRTRTETESRTRTDTGSRTRTETEPRPRTHTSAPSGRAKIVNLLSEEFDISGRSMSTKELPQAFTSPPLMEGLLQSVQGVLGPDAQPTPIQALSLKHLVTAEAGTSAEGPKYREYLLASETGSGKSIAYLLPMLQDLKQSELSGTKRPGSDASATRRAMNPRALVLAPTHELSRQLAGFAKELLHHIKLRVLCASRANVTSRKHLSLSKMAEALVEGESGELEFAPGFAGRSDQSHPVDVVVGTPSKVLELIRGRGWDHEPEEDELWPEKRPRRKVNVGEPQMSLADIEWVVVDEADVLFDSDFQEATRMILNEISTARGHPIPFEPNLDLSSKEAPTPVNYPFNLVLTSATIPSSLAAYLDRFHPALTRLASPHLHRLPPSLKTEHFSWTGGNRDADIEHRLRRVWSDDMQKTGTKSKVLVFCNKSARVENLGEYLREKGIANVALTSAGQARLHGSNHHLDGFLRIRDAKDAPVSAPSLNAAPEPTPVPVDAGRLDAGAARSAKGGPMDDLKEVPHVMITTSLLSRGLDFAPDVRHVFIVDEPRNMVDFLHRAGRSGRAGESGKVVVFGKTKGRGSEKTRVVRKKVGALVA